MKTYSKPELEVQLLSSFDIITMSGGDNDGIDKPWTFGFDDGE